MRRLLDAQQALGFLMPQHFSMEQRVYETKYPSFDYASLIPVITEGNEWARGTMFRSMDIAGDAQWLNGGAFDMPLADVTRGQFLTAFQMAGIGYEWNLEEISVAQQEGTNLPDMKATAARKIAERKLYKIAMLGDAEKGWTGLLNDPSVTATDVAANGTGSSTFWANKTAQQILTDINEGISGGYVDSMETEVANTVLVPTLAHHHIASRPMSNDNPMTVLQYIRENNVLTATTGEQLVIRAQRDLATADPGGDGRMIIYRRDPEVVRFHLPMPHRFLPPFQKSAMLWEVGGIMRTGGTEIRTPVAVRYLDGIWPAP